MTQPMSPEQLKSIIRQCLREEQVIFREAVREEMKDIGLILGDKEDNRAIANDLRFLRSMREKFDSTSSRVGGAVILAMVGGVVWIIVEAGKMFWGQR